MKRQQIALIAASLACSLGLAIATAAPVSAQSRGSAAQAGQEPQGGARRRAAPPIAMLCAFEDKGYSGWVPEIVMVTRQENGRIEAFDPILQSLVGKPIKAVVVSDTRHERVYGWALAGVRNASGQWAERIDFRLSLRKSDSSAVMTVTPSGYDNVITGEGVCGQASSGPQR
ncbi:hypothetical protein [Paracoccus cavernae]|uniref:hypothetical protein n=1 Tax=Paracoccus cavernae TaxID=1571207 RepID=UPI0035F47D18